MNLLEAFKLNEEQRKIIEDKIENSISLTIEEQYFMCENITLESCSNNPLCFDVYYRKLFLAWTSPDPLLQITENDEINFQLFVNEWEQAINTTQIPGSILYASAKETKNEIRYLKKENPQSDNVEVQNIYEEKYFNLLAWSKFRNVLVNRIFNLSIKNIYYSLFLNGKEVRFDYESCEHILARHFGHGMKEYSTAKDHFYEVFKHTDLHTHFEIMFSDIDNSDKFKNDSIEVINIRYLEKLYRIYINRVIVIENGKSIVKDYSRLSTFFPLSDKNHGALFLEFEEQKINDDLSIFTKK